MKKSDLRSRDIIEARERGTGNLGLLVEREGKLVILFQNGCGPLSSWKDDLTYAGNISLDIVRIRRPKDNFQMLRDCLREAPVIWERDEVETNEGINEGIAEGVMIILDTIFKGLSDDQKKAVFKRMSEKS